MLVVKGASKSLLESDFYRLAPQGQHLDGWAGGIHKGWYPIQYAESILVARTYHDVSCSSHSYPAASP